MNRERGSAALEITLVTPLLILVLLFVIGLGRLASARGEVDGAARDAARAASITRNPAAAVTAAKAAAEATLADRLISCHHVHVSTDTSDFQPGGSVTVDVACDVDLADVAPAGFGTRTLHGHAIAVIDTYRGSDAPRP